MHYVTSLRTVERIARSHIVVSVVISKDVEASILVLIKLSTVVNLAVNSATTLWVARELTSLPTFHGDENYETVT